MDSSHVFFADILILLLSGSKNTPTLRAKGLPCPLIHDERCSFELKRSRSIHAALAKRQKKIAASWGRLSQICGGLAAPPGNSLKLPETPGLPKGLCPLRHKCDRQLPETSPKLPKTSRRKRVKLRSCCGTDVKSSGFFPRSELF